MSLLSENKLALLAIAVVSVLVLGYVFLPNPNDQNSENQDNPLPNPRENDYGLFLTAQGDNQIITNDEETATITVSVSTWIEGQDKRKEDPKGDPIENIPIELTTSMGYFSNSDDAKYTGTTRADGTIHVTLVGGEIKGVATVTAEALDGSGQADSVRIFIVDVILSPVEVIINKNEIVNFEVSVDGIDDPDLVYYRWKNYDVMGYYKPLNDEIVYPTGIPARANHTLTTHYRT